MTRASVLRLAKGDIIIERVNGKKRMIPVKQVEFDACSTRGVHVNRNACYDSSAVVDLVEGEGTLGDLEDAVNEGGADQDENDDIVDLGDLDKYADFADLLVKS
jgi:hypothetical protein